MVADVVVGIACVAFGAAHIVWTERLHNYYRDHWLFRFLTSTKPGIMKVHAALLMGMGVLVVGLAIARR